VDFMMEDNPHIVADIKSLPFKDNSVCGIICNAILEYVDRPFQALNEPYRILSEGGELALYIPWIREYHSAPCAYFRYTQDGIRSLSDKFSDVQIVLTDFYGLQPNRVYCALHLLLPPNHQFKAMLCECVPVVTDRGALPEVVGDVGFHVPYGDSKATAAAISKALNCDKGKEARERIKRVFPQQKGETKLIMEIQGPLEA